MTGTSSNLPLSSNTTLEDITRIINMHVQAGHEGAHIIGQLYNEVVEKRLALIAGYKDTRAYFTRNVKALSQTTLSLYGRVAKLFTLEVCKQYGPTKLNALVQYAEAAGVVLPVSLADFSVTVPDDEGGAQDKLFGECSVDEIVRATKARRAPPKSNVPVADQARLLFLVHSIGTAFASISPVTLSSRATAGKTFINLQGVPLAELPRLLQALQEGMDTEPTLGLKGLPVAVPLAAA